MLIKIKYVNDGGILYEGVLNPLTIKSIIKKDCLDVYYIIISVGKYEDLKLDYESKASRDVVYDKLVDTWGQSLFEFATTK